MSKTIMLIHGASLTPASWDRFRGFYDERGYQVLTPAWPHLDRSVAELKRNPGAGIARLGLQAIVDHYDVLIRPLPDELRASYESD